MGVIPFPRFNLTDVPASLRRLADQVESGERPTCRVVVCMESEGGGHDYCAIGEDLNMYHAIGLLHSCIVEIGG